ncbi:MAG: LPS assembly lipoprotein LptE [Candidatus Azotimanducaceae bacterium WSBS_2022_MAG_OTU7]
MLLGVAGCGFQLRGVGIDGVDSLNIIGSSAAPLTSKSLRQVLEDRNVQVVAASADVVSVQLLDERSHRRSVATTAVFDAAEYELRLELDISISRGENLLLEHATLVSQRVYAVDSNNVSGSYEEQSLLLSEMRINLAEQLIRRINFLAGSKP